MQASRLFAIDGSVFCAEVFLLDIFSYVRFHFSQWICTCCWLFPTFYQVGHLPLAVSVSLCHYCAFLQIESAVLNSILIWSRVEGFSFLHRAFLSIWLNAKNALSQQHTWSLCAAATESRIPVHSVSPACYTSVCYFWKSVPQLLKTC